jgi:hypothetical protein
LACPVAVAEEQDHGLPPDRAPDLGQFDGTPLGFRGPRSAAFREDAWRVAMCTLDDVPFVVALQDSGSQAKTLVLGVRGERLQLDLPARGWATVTY